MKFKTHYTSEPYPGEVNSGEILVETAGYVSAEKRISNLMLAGQRLADYRKGLYDFDHNQELDESFSDPTRSKNYDLADAFQDELSLHERLSKAGVKVNEPSSSPIESKSIPEAPGKPDDV